MFNNVSKKIALGLFLLMLMFIISLINVPFESSLTGTFIKNIVLRLLGGSAFLLVLSDFGYSFLNIKKLCTKNNIIILIPGLLVAFYNLPVMAMIHSTAVIEENGLNVLLFVTDSFATGFFEEIVFRGVILIVILQKLPHTKKGVFQTIVFSSLIFSLLHIFNLFYGAGLLPTLLQVGYSFLVGMLFASVFVLTNNIFSAVLVHGLYNTTGLLFVTLGHVYFRYDVFTIISTALLASYASWYYIKHLNKIPLKQILTLITPKI
jgi:membrane protease YdiL (CAAX protease family)